MSKNKDDDAFLFIGGELDGKRLKIPHHLEIYRDKSGGDYFIWTIKAHSNLTKNPYFFFYLHESLSYDEGIEKLLKNYHCR